MLFLQQWLFFGLFFSPCAVCAWFCAIGLLFSVWLPGLPGRAGWAGEPWVVAGNDCLHGSRRAANRLRRVCRMACSVMPSGPFWPPAGAVLQGQTARGGKWLGVSGLLAMAALSDNGERFFTPPASLPSVSQAVDVCLEHGVAVGAGSVAVGRVVGVETAAGLPCVGHAVVVGVGWGG